jgi:hypothetical protein
MNINFKDLQKSHGDKAKELMQEIGKITGAGYVDTHEGGIDLTTLSDADKKKIDALLAKKSDKEGAK